MACDRRIQRISYVFLLASPILVIGVAVPRGLRATMVHWVIGGVLFVALSIASWVLGGCVIRSGQQGRRLQALAGSLLVAVFAIVALFWVGLGPPWLATPVENQMRYLVLMAMSALVSVGIVVLRAALSEAGERFYSTLALGAIALAGPLYLAWNCFEFAISVARERTDKVPAAFAELSVVGSLLLDLGGTLTYLATAAISASMGRAGWLTPWTARAFVILNGVALLCLAIRGVQFPDPAALSVPWYANLGFIAGIPAVPFIAPYLLGVLVLRRAGSEPT